MFAGRAVPEGSVVQVVESQTDHHGVALMVAGKLVKLSVEAAQFI
jgi:ribosomal protein L2